MYPEFRSGCPVASTLDLFGDKWTLVVLRTLLAGRTRYGDLLDIAEGIASNTLADRLARLEAYGMISKQTYSAHPTRYDYRLTTRGADALPILQAMAHWSQQHIPGRWPSPSWFADGKPDAFYPELKSP